MVVFRNQFFFAVTALLSAAICSSREFPSALNLPSELPLSSYETAGTLQGIRFRQPVQAFSHPRVGGYFFTVERQGVVQAISSEVETAHTVLDVSEATGPSTEGDAGMLSAALHPEFPDEPYLFAYYTVLDSTSQGEGIYRHLARFEVNPETLVADSESELVLIHQFDPAIEHKGGSICFGPDGYLYLALGDGGPAAWETNTQQIDRGFFGAIIRIDIDESPENLIPNPHPASKGGYRIPIDNPYVGVSEFNGESVNPFDVRTEFFAVGFRNPFRMTINPTNGDVWVADVGSSVYEELNFVEAGKNYGWPFFEGADYRRDDILGGIPSDVSFEGPVWGFARDGATAIVLGDFYEGFRFPELSGRLIVGDFVSGDFYALNGDPQDLDPLYIGNAGLGITHFATDPRDGGLLISDFNAWRMLVLEAVVSGEENLPDRLSEIGLFSDLESLTPVPGLEPYSINVPFWSDYAIKSRFFAIPDTAVIGFHPDGNWALPAGALWVKHFELETVRGEPASAIRLETRILVKTEDGVYGATYRWNEAQTDAILVNYEGEQIEIPIVDFDGHTRSQKWLFPSRAACLSCHTEKGGYALGFNTPQMNVPLESDTTQIQRIAAAGYFDAGPDNFYALSRLAKADDETASLTQRVKSYLTANCVQCHQPGGPAVAGWDGRYETLILEAGLIDEKSIRGGVASEDRLVARGSTEHSILLQRLMNETNRMPPLATFERNEEAIELLRRWIEEELPSLRLYDEWAADYFTPTEEVRAADRDPDLDGSTNRVEYLAGTNPLDSGGGLNPRFHRVSGGFEVRFVQPANTAFRIYENRENLEGSWRPMDFPENTRWYPPESREVRVLIPSNSDGKRFFYVDLESP